MSQQPPPLPSRRTFGRGRMLIGLALVSAMVVGLLVAFRLMGLICPFYVPTGAMTPAVSIGDHVIMENFTYQFRQPHRGDIAVFRTDGISALSPKTRFIKRIAGEPGERVMVSGGQLFINDHLLMLSNAVGAIRYSMPSYPRALAAAIPMAQTNLVVPDGEYYMLGDNSTNSYDSRFWGSVPRQNIIGRIGFCYWPPSRIGLVR